MPPLRQPRSVVDVVVRANSLSRNSGGHTSFLGAIPPFTDHHGFNRHRYRFFEHFDTRSRTIYIRVANTAVGSFLSLARSATDTLSKVIFN